MKARAQKLGFVAFGVTDACLSQQHRQRLTKAIDAQWHGDMDWMAETLDRRLSPDALWPDARCAIVVAYNYAPETDPMAMLTESDKGLISVYARNRDYHDIIKGKLKELAGILARRADAAVKVFVDTAPLSEKPVAQNAGIGWQGKHTVIVNREHGCWLFLGTILTNAALPVDRAETDHCGSCRRCIDICPTNAFPAPYRLDARRCIAYLTNEYKGVIPVEFRKALGNRIFGCDDCLAVCPWNKFARATADVRLQARDDLHAPCLEELVLLDDTAFRKKFAGSPVKRLGRDAFLRNVLLALGNARSCRIDRITGRLTDPNPVVRGAAVWALRQHLDAQAFATISADAIVSERDQGVIAEWQGTAP